MDSRTSKSIHEYIWLQIGASNKENFFGVINKYKDRFVDKDFDQQEGRGP